MLLVAYSRTQQKMSNIIETLVAPVMVKLNDQRRSSYFRKRPTTIQGAVAYSQQQKTSSVVIGLSIVLTFITIFLYTLIRIQHLLNDYLDDKSSRGTGGACMEISNVFHHGTTTNDNDRFIIFQPILEGQGTGNIMSGLLAVHLLGLEFNRTVCVSKSFINFHMAFEIANPQVAIKCRQLLDCGQQPIFNMQHHIRIINYLAAPNECALQTKLASTLDENRILWIMANTYPRWPPDNKIPDNFFFQNYQARPRLIDMLPYNVPPRTVVHLRFQDNSRDIRKGLDNTTLHNLGKSISSSSSIKNGVPVSIPPVYLVSNHVAFFDFFEHYYGWDHPIWDAVTHSALAISWGNRKNESVRRIIHDTMERDKQTMQLWADWYTLLRAKYIIHTASDFSSSAAHWMKIDSMIIEGSSEDNDNDNDHHHGVRLSPESWRRDNDAAVPLVERRIMDETASVVESSRQLQRCNEDPTLNGANTVSVATLTAPKLKVKKQQMG